MFKDLQLGLITWLIFGCGITTVVASCFGIVGSIYKHENSLKVYGVFMLAVVCTQTVLGAFLFQLKVDDVKPKWDTDSNQGMMDRAAFQNAESCCGWNVWTDAIGALRTPCPFMPTYITDPVPGTCRSAVVDFFRLFVTTVANAAVAVAAFEFIALFSMPLLLFAGKQKTDFAEHDFHY